METSLKYKSPAKIRTCQYRCTYQRFLELLEGFLLFFPRST